MLHLADTNVARLDMISLRLMLLIDPFDLGKGPTPWTWQPIEQGNKEKPTDDV